MNTTDANISHGKAYSEFAERLITDADLMFHTKKTYERAFGRDQQTRTRKQWLRLVNVYGLPTVCEKEGMTSEEVQQRCNETFTQRITRIARENNLAK